MTNTEMVKLIKADRKPPAGLLTHLEKQHFFLLRMALVLMPCPACNKPFSKIDSLGGHPEKYTFGGMEQDYQCPHCHRTVNWCLGLFGGHQWWELKEPLPPLA